MTFPTRLLEGYRDFCQSRLPIEQDRYRELAETGQQPEVMVVGCCDSRVSPEVIFNARPGELFVVRNVANLVPPYSPDSGRHGVSAALEFAVQALRVKHIVVLGHGRCGGIRAFASHDKPLSPGDFIGKWISLIEPAADEIGPRGDRDLPQYLHELEQASVKKTLENLKTFPCVRILHERGKLKVHGAFFDVSTGVLNVLDLETGNFHPAGEGRKPPVGF